MTGFLEKVYAISDVKAVMDHYDAWSETYDTEITENGYALPGRIAEAAAGVMTDKTHPILDFGCGTGLSGAALAAQGFTAIDGMDVSAEMMAQAERKAIYRHLTCADPDAPPPITKGHYPLIIACGVIGKGAAPLEVLDALAASLIKGGKLAFSLNSKALSDPDYPARVRQHTEDGFDLIFEKRGEHLPGIDLTSTVFILEKT